MNEFLRYVHQCWAHTRTGNQFTKFKTFNGVAKCVQKVWFDNVEWWWMEMLNQRHSRGWPNVFNMLNSTCWIQQCWAVLNGNVESTSFKKVAKRVQQCWAVLNGNVESTLFKRVAKRVQQCWAVLNGNVESTLFKRVAKRVQHVEFNKVEWRWWIISEFAISFNILQKRWTLLNPFTQGLKEKKILSKTTFILAFPLWSRITSWGNQVGSWKSFLPIAAARKITKLNNANYMSYTACTFYLLYEDKIVTLTASVLTHSNTKPSRPKTGKISQFSIFNTGTY